MKTIKQLFENAKGLESEKETEILDEAYGADHLAKADLNRPMGFPKGEKDAPAVLVLRRKAIRVYPDNQKVALYYSQSLDRYITIPFGPNVKDMALNEATLRVRRVPVDDEDDDGGYNAIQRQAAYLAKGVLSGDINKKNDFYTKRGQLDRVIDPNRAIANKYVRDHMIRQIGMSGDHPAAIAGAQTRVYLDHMIAKMRGFEPIDIEGKPRTLGKKAPSMGRTSDAPDITAKMSQASQSSKEPSSMIKGMSQASGPKQEQGPTQTPGPRITRKRKMPPSMKTPKPSTSGEMQPMSPKTIKENFREKLAILREEKDQSQDDLDSNSLTSLAKDLAPGLGTYRSGLRTKRAWDQGDYVSAAGHGALTGLSALSDAAVVSGLGSGVGAVGKGITTGLGAAGRFAGKALSKSTSKASALGSKEAFIGSAAAAAAKKPSFVSRMGSRLRRGAEAGLAAATGYAAGKASGNSDSGEPSFKQTTPSEFGYAKPNVSGASSNSEGPSSPSVGVMYNTKKLWGQTNESSIKNIKKMISEDLPSQTFNVGGKQIELSNRVAKKIVAVYESLNTKNKKKIEKLLSEDASSFRKVINFAIKS